jgi:hypothetical protein
VPKREDYEGMTLGEKVRHLAEHHKEHRTRHLSRDEYDILMDAATALDRISVGPRATTT